MLADVHCHLTFKEFENNLPNIIKNAEKVNMIAIIASGTKLNENKKVLQLSKKYNLVKASFGLYPTHASKLNKKDLEKEINFIKENKNNIIAIGEVGLDLKELNSLEKQKSVFQKLIELTEEINKPIIVHSRKAELDCIEMLETSKNKNIIMHCFGGNFKLIKRCYENNWFFSIPTNIVRSQHFQKLVNEVSLSNILTETDAPYLSPYKNKINEPSFVVETIKKISEIRKLSKKDVEKIIFTNYKKIFLK